MPSVIIDSIQFIGFQQPFMVLSPILADFIFSDCALNPMFVSSSVLKTRETCGSSIGNCKDCLLLGSDALSSGGYVLLFQSVGFCQNMKQLWR